MMLREAILDGARVSLTKKDGANGEFVLSIHLTEQELASILGSVVDVSRLTTKAQRAAKRAKEKAAKEQKEATARKLEESRLTGSMYAREVKELRYQGHTQTEAVREVAKRHSVVIQNVVHLMQYANGRNRQMRNERIYGLHEAGKTNGQISKQIGLSVVSVSNIINTIKRQKLGKKGGAR